MTRMIKRYMVPLLTFVGLAVASVSHSAELTVYYGATREHMEPVLKAFADAHPQITVKSFRAPTEELAATMDMELKAGRPKFDVICSVYSPIWTLQQRYKSFRRLSPREGEHILQGLRDPEGIQVPFGFGIYVIQHNTKLVSKAEAPRKWADLLDPKWNNKIVLADPRSSGSVHALVWYITQHMAPKGTPYGWAYFEELKKLNPRYVASHGTIGEMVNIGERPIGLQVMQVVETAVAKGEPIWWTFPEDGIPAETSMIAVRADSPNQKAADDFTNFMVSKEGQSAISRHMGFSPVRDDIPFAYKDGTQVKNLNVIRRDDIWIANNRADVIARFRDIIK